MSFSSYLEEQKGWPVIVTVMTGSPKRDIEIKNHPKYSRASAFKDGNTWNVYMDWKASADSKIGSTKKPSEIKFIIHDWLKANHPLS